MKLPTHICPICGVGKGGADHRTCAKILRKRHANDKRETAKPKKRLNENNRTYLEKTGHD